MSTRSPESPECGKRVFANRQEAVRDARRVSRESGQLAKTYRCGLCGLYHIAHVVSRPLREGYR